MNSPNSLDAVRLNFSQTDLLALNIALALIMYGVALDLKLSDFHYLIKNPKSFFLGIFSQFILLPFLTWGLVRVFHPPPSLALGMFLVAACPGGNVSNFLTHLAKGNTALSVSLTAFSTLTSIVFTPLNFAFWAGLYQPANGLLQQISLDITEVFMTVTLILGVPLILGIATNQYFPRFSENAKKILRPLSLLIFASFVGIAFLGNWDNFLTYIATIFFWVLAHNALAVSAGYLVATLGKLPKSDRKTLSLETGIQNSGLGLVLIFMYFDGLGGMAIITALWGIWHLISGISLALFWKKQG